MTKNKVTANCKPFILLLLSLLFVHPSLLFQCLSHVAKYSYSSMFFYFRAWRQEHIFSMHLHIQEDNVVVTWGQEAGTECQSGSGPTGLTRHRAEVFCEQRIWCLNKCAHSYWSPGTHDLLHQTLYPHRIKALSHELCIQCLRFLYLRGQ